MMLEGIQICFFEKMHFLSCESYDFHETRDLTFPSMLEKVFRKWWYHVERFTYARREKSFRQRLEFASADLNFGLHCTARHATSLYINFQVNCFDSYHLRADWTRRLDFLRENEKISGVCGHKLLIIKFLTPLQTKEELNFILIDASPLYWMIENWVSEIRKSWTSTSDASLSGLPAEITTPKMFENMHKMTVIWKFFEESVFHSMVP
jgi:hypothetical protein